MFRSWFKEPEREESGLLLEAVSAIRTYRGELKRLIEKQTPECERYTRFDIWSRGLTNAIYELEESVYAASKFRERITNRLEKEMPADELEAYRCHLYFYKNGLVRLFSVLDKLGYLMNDLFALRTQRAKRKFSYFTVLRQMQHLRAEPALAKELTVLKDQTQDVLNRLRHKRNMEIHLVNSEILDDLLHIDACRSDRMYIEDLSANMNELQQGYEMVCKAVTAVFQYIYERRKM